MTRPDTPQQLTKRLVHLVQCARRTCLHVLTEDEYEWVPHNSGETALCPKCLNDAFFSLNEFGQRLTMRDREKFRAGIDPNLIQPTPRMGKKRRAQLLAAKHRALENGNAPQDNAP